MKDREESIYIIHSFNKDRYGLAKMLVLIIVNYEVIISYADLGGDRYVG